MLNDEKALKMVIEPRVEVICKEILDAGILNPGPFFCETAFCISITDCGGFVYRWLRVIVSICEFSNGAAADKVRAIYVNAFNACWNALTCI